MTQPMVSESVVDLRAARELLGRPFLPVAAEFMVISTTKDGSRASIATYLSRTSIEDRLDFVVGSENWEANPIPDGECVRCELKIFGTPKASLGQGSDRRAQEANAFKRAARAFGVGRYLYTRRPIWVPVGPGSMQVSVNGRSAYIPDELVAHLRQGYGEYLERVAIPMFGDPLDHCVREPSSSATGSPAAAAPAADVGAAGMRNGGGRPQAVATNDSGEGPAAPEVRERLRRAIERGHFGSDAVGSVSQLLYGERITDRLGATQMCDLTDAITLAAEGAFTDETLGGLASRGIDQPDLAVAREEFMAYVLRVAQRRQEASS